MVEFLLRGLIPESPHFLFQGRREAGKRGREERKGRGEERKGSKEGKRGREARKGQREEGKGRETQLTFNRSVV